MIVYVPKLQLKRYHKIIKVSSIQYAFYKRKSIKHRGTQGQYQTQALFTLICLFMEF